MNNEKLEVIIDGANLLHDDRGIEIYDEEGETVMQNRPERLAKGIEYCIKQGWKTTAILKNGTYVYSKLNQESEYIGDINIIDNLISNNNVMLVPQKKEDIYIIQLALERNAWIITRDRFKEEREKYPEMDWEDIDARTLRSHAYVGENFLLPGLPTKSLDKQQDVEYSEFKKLQDKVEFLENRIQSIEDVQSSNQKLLENEVTINDSNDVVSSVIENMLKKKKEVSVNKLYDEVSKAVLGTKAAKKTGSAKRLRKELGYSRSTGFLQFLIQRSQRKIRQKKRGGELFVSYC